MLFSMFEGSFPGEREKTNVDLHENDYVILLLFL